MSFSLVLPQRRGEGHVHPQDLPPSSVPRPGRVGGRQPARPAAERNHPENLQRRDGGHTQTLPVYSSEAAGGTYGATVTTFCRHPRSVTAAIVSRSLQDALVNLIRRARPVFLQCVSAKSSSGGLDVPALRVQLHSTQILSALQLYRTGRPFTSDQLCVRTQELRCSERPGIKQYNLELNKNCGKTERTY